MAAQDDSSVTCECTHLTSFGTFAKVFIMEGGDFTALDINALNLTLPFLSLEELGRVVLEDADGAKGWIKVWTVVLRL